MRKSAPDIAAVYALDEPIPFPSDQPRVKRLGELLINQGAFEPADIDRVLRHAADEKMRFGEAALALGMVTPEALNAALSMQFMLAHASSGSGLHRDLVVAFQASGNAAQDIRALRNDLLLRTLKNEQSARAIAVLSTERGDGRSFVAANLAIAFAQIGMKTLLIDADMHHPRQHQLFAIQNILGLAGYLDTRGEIAAHYVVEPLPGLSVIPVGHCPSDAPDMLLRQAFLAFLESAQRSFDVVLVDTPAASTGSDAVLIAAAAGSAILVSRRHKTRAQAMTRLVNRCRDAGAAMIGGVMIA